MQKFRTVEELGAILRRERKRRGYTQAQLAEFAGIGVSYVVNLERGKRTAEIGKAFQLASLLSIDLFADERGLS
jgi:transcriptional regulator with XRE-family HTH domain